MERANNSSGVRKGTWSKEEDDLLKNCVEQFGEGGWHLVPLRAGLNRCRKSCRLRWMNYLRPDITRGNFIEAEIDLMIRLHNLLGNRWSLIAGRIPGRTANDIKNFWNTRMEKKSGGGKGQPIQKTITKTNIIRPRPYSFSNSLIQDGQVIGSVTDHDHESNNPNNSNKNHDDDKLQQSSSIIESVPSSSREADKCIDWCRNLLDTTKDKLETDNLFLENKGEEAGLSTGHTNHVAAGLMNDLTIHDFEFEV